MEPKTFAACDLGAESGRVILGKLSNAKLELEEVHRFLSGPTHLFGSLRWNILRLFDEIKTGLHKACQTSKKLDGISVDAWGVDYAWSSADEPLLGVPFHYRDSRTDSTFPQFLDLAGKDLIFSETGIQFMQINTLYQLYDDVLHRPKIIDQAKRFLPIADYLHFLLTGEAVAEISSVSTTQIFNPGKDSGMAAARWSQPLIEKLGCPSRLFPQVVKSGAKVGDLLPAVAEETTGSIVPVFASCSHDTGAAVAGVPAEGTDWAFISSGTWSLVGIETDTPIINSDSLAANFTNELGFGGAVRFLKNIVGLWILQEVRRDLERRNESLDYADLNSMAVKSPALKSLIDPNHPDFLKPGHMIDKIRKFCTATRQAVPDTAGELARCVLESLAVSYAVQIALLEKISGRPINVVHIVGGGSRSTLLNQFTADATGKRVVAGPVEGSAIGNLLIQAVGAGELTNLTDIRSIIRNSFPISTFNPGQRDQWLDALNRFIHTLLRTT
jgi:rhamnulokinase